MLRTDPDTKKDQLNFEFIFPSVLVTISILLTKENCDQESLVFLPVKSMNVNKKQTKNMIKLRQWPDLIVTFSNHSLV